MWLCGGGPVVCCCCFSFFHSSGPGVCDGVPSYLATRARVPLRSSLIPMLVLHQRKEVGVGRK